MGDYQQQGFFPTRVHPKNCVSIRKRGWKELKKRKLRKCDLYLPE